MTEALSSLVDAFKTVGVSRAFGAPVRLGGKEPIPAPVVCAADLSLRGLSLRGILHGRH